MHDLRSVRLFDLHGPQNSDHRWPPTVSLASFASSQRSRIYHGFKPSCPVRPNPIKILHATSLKFATHPTNPAQDFIGPRPAPAVVPPLRRPPAGPLQANGIDPNCTSSQS